MGSQISKLDDQEETGNGPSTPVSVPKLTNSAEYLDPRSPSENIYRTPLFLDTNNKEDSCLDDELCPKTNSLLVLTKDPRSPTTEYVRTPIVVGTIDKQNPSKPHNKNLDNARKALIQVTPTSAKSTSNLEKRTIIPPKLLESSPKSVDCMMKKRRSYVGLLETNIDFTETNLDDVLKTKTNLNRTLPDRVNEDCITPLSNKIKQQMETLRNDNHDPRSPAIGFNRSPIDSLDQIAAPEVEPCNTAPMDWLCPPPPPHIVEADPPVDDDDDDDGVVDRCNIEEVQPVLVANNLQHPNEVVTVEQVVNITAHVKDFDKKLTNLIYEDEIDNGDALPKIQKPTNNNRTPLGVRNTIGESKKSASKLKVSDRPRKLDYKVSKIPILKNRKSQCENMPPTTNMHNHVIVKPKKSQWDADKTLVI